MNELNFNCITGQCGILFLRDIIKWEESRTKLYWRLRRKLAESELKTTIKSLNPKLKMGQKQVRVSFE